MTSTLTKTAIATGVLGAALLAFSKTKKGQQIKGELRDNVDEIYQQVQDKLSNLGEVTQEKYSEMVEQVVNKYTKGKKLAKSEITALTNDVKKRWKEFKKELAA